ncbi:hypothetical protein H6F43_04210 [Leptolyngbya sp. FACHB-36]|uniref:hypothetical protein n=1 Tax=Leptolyngbya sp. FACHB-36 TaxID=2692808 RepID=UPI001681A6BF|nr:hypothetical protein [Leptolyngbya sp. FACHB-36]MBD2019387.1 hypothetical protein [Leptolyngbya sp. FACHB-36]
MIKADDFWGIKHLPDVLEVYGAVLPTAPEELYTAIAQWKSEDRQIEIVPFPPAWVGTGYGYYALLGSRKSSAGPIDGTVYALIACTETDAAEFAARHQIVFIPRLVSLPC